MSSVRFDIYRTNIDDPEGPLVWYDLIITSTSRDLSEQGLKRELLSIANTYAGVNPSAWCGRRLELRYNGTCVSGVYVGYGTMNSWRTSSA